MPARRATGFFLARGVRVYTMRAESLSSVNFGTMRPRTSGACGAGGELEGGMAQHRGDSEAAPGCPLSVRSVDGVRPGCYAAAESESESKGLVRTSWRSDYQGPSHRSI
jgi:hypothetical protein